MFASNVPFQTIVSALVLSFRESFCYLVWKYAPESAKGELAFAVFPRAGKEVSMERTQERK